MTPRCSLNRPVNQLQRGFTLLELLVVIVIIGIMAGFAVISLSWGQGDEVKKEAQRFAALVELAAQESVLQGIELGLRFHPEKYEFVALVGEAWQPLEDDELLHPRELPPRVELKLWVEGQEISLAEELAAGAHSFLLSSGEAVPFKLAFIQEDTEQSYQVSVAYNGTVVMETVHDPYL